MNLNNKSSSYSYYTKELATTSLQEYKRVSRVIIPPCRGMNQSQDEYEINHRENAKWQETTDFLPRFTCLPTRYIPVVSTNTWWFNS